MKLIAHQNAASSLIAVTDTATALFTLINTAGTVTNSQDYFLNPNNGSNRPADGIVIMPEDGDIRVGFEGNTPTAAVGMLLKEGVKYKIPSINLANLKLIRTGASNVSCSIDLFKADRSDSFESSLEVAGGSGSISLTGDLPDTAAGDLASISGSISGAGSPTVDSYTSTDINLAANTADQEIIAAPGASKEIWIYGINFTMGTGDGSISFQDSDDTAITGVMTFKQDTGMAHSPSGNFSMPLWKVATNKAFEADTVTSSADGSISYAIISV